MFQRNLFHEFDENPSLESCFCEGECDCGKTIARSDSYYRSTSEDLCLFCGESVGFDGVCKRTRCSANHY